MILPLQTWQHQDPKGLWPALGGLAVLAHIGVIGMSVPYLLSLREANEQNAAIAIPIELSVEPSANSAPAAAPAIENDQPAVPESRAVGEAAIASNPKASSSGRSHISKPFPVESPSTPKSASEQLDNTAESQGKSVEESGASETTDTSDTSTEASSQSTDALNEDPLPVIDGENLAAPLTNSEGGQLLQIRAVGAPQRVPVEEFTVAPPELINTDYVGLISPESRGCKAVSALATQSPLVYRIQVDRASGAIIEANLYGNNAIALYSADDEAVACLIEKTGITFSATVVGVNDKKIDDSWLMTFELSEQ